MFSRQPLLRVVQEDEFGRFTSAGTQAGPKIPVPYLFDAVVTISRFDIERAAPMTSQTVDTGRQLTSC